MRPGHPEHHDEDEKGPGGVADPHEHEGRQDSVVEQRGGHDRREQTGHQPGRQGGDEQVHGTGRSA